MFALDVWCVIDGKIYNEFRSFDSVESVASILNLLRKSKYLVLNKFLETAIFDDCASVDELPIIFVGVIRHDRLVNGRPTVKIHRFYTPFYLLDDNLEVVEF